jgi:hypothetical protein
MLIIGSYSMGIWGIIISVIIGVLSFCGLEHYVRKRDKNFGFDPSKYTWCKTCKNYKKVKDWDYVFSQSTQSKELPSESKLPCKIFDQAKGVWINYFNLSPAHRKLYPDDCKFWTRK